jgi:predicted TPR repeat methyltransferase
MRYIEINGARTYLTSDEREIYDLIDAADNNLSATVLDEFQVNVAEKMYSKGILSMTSDREENTIFSINKLSKSLWRF